MAAWLLILSVALCVACGCAQAEFKYSRLRSDLLAGYDKDSIPLRDGEDVLPVVLRFHVDSILTIDPISGVVEFVAQLEQEWNDTRLAWQPARYDNVTHLAFNPAALRTIWTPSLALFPTKRKFSDDVERVSLTVQPSGLVLGISKGALGMLCPFANIKHFPFDAHTCTIRLRAGEPGLALLPDDEGALSGLQGITLREWDVSSATVAFAAAALLDPLQGRLDELAVNYTVTRASTQYELRVVLPAALVTMLSFSCLYVSPKVNARLGIPITTTLTMVAIMWLVSREIPVTSGPTWIDKFLLGSFVFNIAASVESFIVFHFFLRSTPVLGSFFRDYSDKRRYWLSDKESDPVGVGTAPPFKPGINILMDHCTDSTTMRLAYAHELNDSMQAHLRRKVKAITRYRAILEILEASVNVVLPAGYILFVAIMYATK